MIQRQKTNFLLFLKSLPAAQRPLFVCRSIVFKLKKNPNKPLTQRCPDMSEVTVASSAGDEG